MSKPKNQKNLRFDWGVLLLIGAGLFTAIQYIRAFHLVDSTTVWSQIGGAVAGFVISGSLVYAGVRVTRIRKKIERRMAWTAFGVIVVLTPVFLTPVNFVTMQNGALAVYPEPARWALAAVAAVVVDAAMLATALSNTSLLPAAKEQTQVATTTTAKPAQPVRNAKAEQRTEQQLREQCEKLQTEYACTESQCGWSPDVDALTAVAGKGKDPRRSAASAKAGHYKSRHPKPIQVPIQVDSSLLIRQEGDK